MKAQVHKAKTRGQGHAHCSLCLLELAETVEALIHHHPCLYIRKITNLDAKDRQCKT